MTSIIKAKCSRVVHEEMDKAVNDDVAQSCEGVMHVTFHDDVYLDLSFATWVAVGRWKKNLCLYSPVRVCSVVMRVKRAHNKLVNPMIGSHEPPLVLGNHSEVITLKLMDSPRS